MGGLITLASVNTHHGVLVGNPIPPPSDRDTVKPNPADNDTVPTPKEGMNSGRGGEERRGEVGDERKERGRWERGQGGEGR